MLLASDMIHKYSWKTSNVQKPPQNKQHTSKSQLTQLISLSLSPFLSFVLSISLATSSGFPPKNLIPSAQVLCKFSRIASPAFNRRFNIHRPDISAQDGFDLADWIHSRFDVCLPLLLLLLLLLLLTFGRLVHGLQRYPFDWYFDELPRRTLCVTIAHSLLLYEEERGMICFEGS